MSKKTTPTETGASDGILLPQNSKETANIRPFPMDDYSFDRPSNHCEVQRPNCHFLASWEERCQARGSRCEKSEMFFAYDTRAICRYGRSGPAPRSVLAPFRSCWLKRKRCRSAGHSEQWLLPIPRDKNAHPTVIETRYDRTLREYQSGTATRHTKPRAIGM